MNYSIINPDWIDSPGHRPNFVKIKNSKIHGKGAFALKNIKKGTFLGHYMGKVTNNKITGPYIFHSIRDNGKTISIDATDKKQSNWTRFMNCSTNTKNENVLSSKLTNTEIYDIQGIQKSIEGYIVFYANRDISKGEELLYYYGDYYAQLMNVKYNTNTT